MLIYESTIDTYLSKMVVIARKVTSAMRIKLTEASFDWYFRMV